MDVHWRTFAGGGTPDHHAIRATRQVVPKQVRFALVVEDKGGPADLFHELSATGYRSRVLIESAARRVFSSIAIASLIISAAAKANSA